MPKKIPRRQNKKDLPPKHIWKIILMSALTAVLIPTILISIVVIPELYESHKAKEKYEKIPKAQAINDFISYKIPSGWTKRESWIIQDPDENKRYQYITLLSPEAASTHKECHMDLSARVSKESVYGGDDRRELTIDGHKAIAFPYLTANYTQNVQIVQPLPDSKNRRIWSVVFLCKTKEETQLNIKVFNEFLDSIKFKD